jgi:predicted anti-sigma-YlaC factor YlaD
MKTDKSCAEIQALIESVLIDGVTDARNRVEKHVGECDDCRKYLSDLGNLSTLPRPEFTLPFPERVTFSATVRSRIESHGRVSKRWPLFVSPVTQVAVLLLVVISVFLYLERTDGVGQDTIPHAWYVEATRYDDHFAVADYDMLDDRIIASMLTEPFQSDQSIHAYDQSGSIFGYELYDEMDDLSEDELDFIFARLEML